MQLVHVHSFIFLYIYTIEMLPFPAKAQCGFQQKNRIC